MHGSIANNDLMHIMWYIDFKVMDGDYIRSAKNCVYGGCQWSYEGWMASHDSIELFGIIGIRFLFRPMGLCQNTWHKTFFSVQVQSESFWIIRFTQTKTTENLRVLKTRKISLSFLCPSYSIIHLNDIFTIGYIIKSEHDWEVSV